jgi:hypothetical protein
MDPSLDGDVGDVGDAAAAANARAAELGTRRTLSADLIETGALAPTVP